MRFFTTSAFAMAIATVAALPQTAISGGANPITAPLGDVALEAGKPFTIKWAHDFGKQVTLNLRRGSDSLNLDDILVIAAQTPNDGEFTWTPPAGLKGGKDYAIEIIADGSANYSPRFQIDSKGPGIGAETAAPKPTSTAASSKPTSHSTTATGTASATPSAEASESAVASGSEAAAQPTISAAPAAAAPASGAGAVGASLTMVLGAVAGALYFL